MTEPCGNPVCIRTATKAGLCSACYHYRWRTGHLRPEHVILRTGQRKLERELVASRYRRDCA